MNTRALISDRFLLTLILLVVVAGLVDAVVGAQADLAVVFGLAGVLLLVVLGRSLERRRPVTVRRDLAGWLEDHAHRTGQPRDVAADRAVETYRRRIDPLEGHTASFARERRERGTVGDDDAADDRDDSDDDAADDRDEDSDDGAANDRDDGTAADDSEAAATVRLTGRHLASAAIGGKAAALDRLVAAGVSVPPAGVITAAAYRRFAARSPLAELLETLDAAELPDPDEHEAEQARIDQAFLDTPMPPGLRRDVLRLAEEVRGEGRLAVRSSATAEDQASASFAGQYRSFLEIGGDADEVLRAVRLVWASLWSPTVRAYRRHRGIRDADLAMAVVVMRQVDAAHAGVAFTQEPGDSGQRMRIEWVEGLAEDLVGGTRTPQVARPPRTEAQEITEGPDGLLSPIAAAALDVEAIFGAPQDVEWAHDGEQLWVVQARPITGQTGPSDDDGFDTPPLDGFTYTSAGLGEMLPGVLPPLLWSMNGSLLEHGFRQLFDQLGSLPDPLDTPFAVIGRFRGRAGLNLDLLKDVATRMPGGTGAELERQYFGELLSEEEEQEAAPGLVARLWALPATLRALRTRRRLRVEAEAVREAVEAVIALDVDPAKLDDAHLLAYWRRLQVLAARTTAAQVAVAATAAATYRTLETFLEPHLGDEAAAATQRLTAGGIEPCGVQTSLELCDLVVDGLGDQVVREALEGAERGADELRRRLDATAAGRRFSAVFRERLQRAGSAAVFGGRTWEEDEQTAWNLLRQAALVELRGARPQAGTDRHAALAQLGGRLSSGWRRRLTRVMTGQLVDMRRRMLRRLADDAARYLSLREQTKLAVLRLGGEARRTARTAADRLVVRGVLEQPDDAELLDVVELEEALAGGAVTPAVIARRRRGLDRARTAGPLPRLFTGRPPAAAAPGGAGGRLDGWAASPGRHRGRVRVVDDVASAVLDQGDVLVAEATDPSWTPLFLTAGAIVVEEGGPLSHAAIVARELGLPAVLNAQGATRRLADGAMTTVDGDAGVVLLDEPAQPTPTTAAGREVTT